MIRASILALVWTNMIIIAFIASSGAIDYYPEEENKTSADDSVKNTSLAIEIVYQTVITHENRGEFITEHNSVRRTVDPIASDMVYMVWSLRLQRMAELMTAACILKETLNDKDLNEITYWFSSGGFNAWNGNAGESLNVSEVVRTWSSEKAYFDYDQLGCQLGRKCMRYAQIVWATTSHVGCSLSYCPKFTVAAQKPQQNTHYVICVYGEGQTKMNNLGDYRKPYKKGNRSCSNCPTGFSNCRQGLCDTQPFCETVVDCSHKSSNLCLCEESTYKSRGQRSIVLYWTTLKAMVTLAVCVSSYG